MNFNSDHDSSMHTPIGTGDAPDTSTSTFEHDFSEGDAVHDPLAGAESGPKLNSGAMVLGLVVVIAVGGLFLMRTLSRATAGSFQASEVEQTVDEFVSQLDGEGGSIELVTGRDEALHLLHHDFTDRQVPLVGTQRNPFIIDVGEDNEITPPQDQGDDPEKIARQRFERERADRRTEIESIADSLRLQAVLKGANPMANISGQYARVGETLEFEGHDVAFTLKSVSNQTAHLIAADSAYELELEFILRLREEP